MIMENILQLDLKCFAIHIYAWPSFQKYLIYLYSVLYASIVTIRKFSDKGVSSV